MSEQRGKHSFPASKRRSAKSLKPFTQRFAGKTVPVPLTSLGTVTTGKSDSLVLPAMQANKAGKNASQSLLVRAGKNGDSDGLN